MSMQTTGPSQCMVCGKNGSSTAGPCHRCLPGLWERFDIEVWSGCLAFDCTPICNVRAHVCGRYQEEFARFCKEAAMERNGA